MLVATRRSARNRRVLPLRSASPAAQTLARAVRRFRLPSHLFIAYVQFLLRPTQLQEGWRFFLYVHSCDERRLAIDSKFSSRTVRDDKKK